MHGCLAAQQLRRHHRVLGEVLGHSAADHEQAGLLEGQLHPGEFQEVPGAVQGHAPPGAGRLVQHQAEAGGAVAEGRAEDGHLLLEGRPDDAVRPQAAVLEVAAHGLDEFPAGVRTRLQGIGDASDGLIARPQLVLVDEGVVDAVDGHVPQPVVVQGRAAQVVAEAHGLEEVLVDDVGAGGDDGVHHVVVHQGTGIEGFEVQVLDGRGQESRLGVDGFHHVISRRPVLPGGPGRALPTGDALRLHSAIRHRSAGWLVSGHCSPARGFCSNRGGN